MARNKYPEVTIGRILDVSGQMFMEKGYEHTTIQDIINALGDLSKGAIYHHFKSKEEIIDAVTERMYGGVSALCLAIKNEKNLNGLEKIRRLLSVSIKNPSQETLAQMMPNLLNNPKLLAKQIGLTMSSLAHDIVEGFIREGIEDGSIKTDYPGELAEVIALLANVWINPIVFRCTPEELRRKCLFFKHLTESLNVPIFDDEMVQAIARIGLVAQN